MIIDRLVELVMALAKNNPSGFTCDLNLDKPMTGFVVAYAATQDSHGAAGLKACILHAIDNEFFVGGWLNPDGRLQFDSVMILDSLDEAIDFGRQQQQHSIWYIDKGVEILL